ncbi:MAG: alanine:cation symporter family protein [Rhodospirillales bacterium]|nr:alanine:cation symporter family protein [Rhodospirillales bacterium]
MSIDSKIDIFVQPFAEHAANFVFYSVPIGGGHEIKLILIWLVVASLFFTIYLGFVNFRYFKHAIDLLREPANPDDQTTGQITRFQALATSLSGTIGLGNIAGVAVAISVGGPGAALWMVFMGLFGMSTKFAEVVMGVKYRQFLDPNHPDRVSGGPMYYIREAFCERNMPLLGGIMGSFFAICCCFGVLGAASLFQTNQVFRQALIITGGEESFLIGKAWMVGLFMVFIVGLVIIGGIRSIAAVTSKIVPFMGGLYILTGLFVIGTYYAQLPTALVSIVTSSFSPEAGLGGFLGALVMGVQRAVFSNEAGLGSAAIAHAAVKTDQPVTQGLVGMLGPFIDTIIVCMVTALVIIVTGAYEQGNGMEGVELTSRAFGSVLPWFPYVLFAVVFLFAYSTLLSWAYYGVKAFTYLFGNTDFNEMLYKIIFCIFIVIGASAKLDNVILLTDSSVFMMAIPNLIGLYMLAPILKKDLKAYAEKLKAA